MAEIDVQCQSFSIVFSCFDVDLKKNTVVLYTDNLFSDTIYYENVELD